MSEKKNSGLAIAGLTLGCCAIGLTLLGFLLSFFIYIGLVCGIVGIVLSAIKLKETMAKAGLALSIISVILFIIVLIVAVILVHQINTTYSFYSLI